MTDIARLRGDIQQILTANCVGLRILKYKKTFVLKYPNALNATLKFKKILISIWE